MNAGNYYQKYRTLSAPAQWYSNMRLPLFIGLLCCIVLMFSCSVIAQDTQQFKSLGALAEKHFADMNFDSAKSYSRLIIDELDEDNLSASNRKLVQGAYYILGRSYSKKSEFEVSNEIWRQQLKRLRAEQPIHLTDILQTRCEIATNYFYWKKLTELTLEIDTIQEIIQMSGNDSKYVQAFLEVLKSHIDHLNRDVNAELKHNQEALKLFRLSGDTTSDPMIRCISGIAYAFGQQKKIPEAINWLKYTQSKLAMRFGTKNFQSQNIDFRLGYYYLLMGDVESCITHSENYLRAIEEHGKKSHPNVPAAFINLGIAYRSYGNLDKSLLYFHAAERVWNKEPGHASRLVYVYSNLASVHLSLGHLDEALTNIQLTDSLAQLVNGADNKIYWANKVQKGQIYEHLGNHVKAQEELLALSAHYMENPPASFGRVIENHLILGRVYRRSGDIINAKKYLNDAQEKLKNSNLPYVKSRINFYKQSALLYLAEHNHLAALAYTDSVFSVLDFNPNDLVVLPSINITSILTSLKLKLKIQSEYFLASPDVGTATLNQTCKATKSMLLKSINELNSDVDKRLFREKFRSTSFQLLHALSLINNDAPYTSYTDDVLTIMELNKSSALLSNLHLNELASANGVESGFYVAQQSLRKQIQKTEHAILMSIESDEIQQDHLEDSLFQLKLELDDLMQNVKTTNPSYFELMYELNGVAIQDLQKEFLGSDDVLIQFFWGDTVIYKLSVSRSSAYVDQIPWDGASSKTLTNWLQNIKSPNSKLAEIHEQGCELYKLLIGESIRNSPLAGHVFIVNDEVGHYIPFEALMQHCGASVDKKYVNDIYSIGYYISSSLALWQSKNQEESSVRFTGYAASYDFASTPDEAAIVMRSTAPIMYKLPGAIDEVRSLVDLVGGEYFLDNDATETNFKRNAPQQKLIHLSLHGRLSDYFPMESGLLFHNDDSLNDGVLTTAEIYGLDLNTELAVLSACETGVGELKSGEGLQSISRAFTYAGAKSTLYSLWKVPDKATKIIMVEFYRGLKGGLRKDEALRQAKLTYLENTTEPQERHPYYWAGFVIQGNTDPIIFENNSKVVYFIVGLSILLGLIFLMKKSTRDQGV